jgi:uncharacterized membrane protein
MEESAMADKDARLLDVIVASYPNVEKAEADFEAVRALYAGLGTSYNFDAAVVHKTAKGRVKIDESIEAGKRHEALKGLGFGLAAGVIAAIFPAVGIGAALVAGGIGGAAIGAIVGHVQSGIPRSELKRIADELDASQAALIVVYETSLADQIVQNIKATHHVISKLADLKTEEIAEEIRQARAT